MILAVMAYYFPAPNVLGPSGYCSNPETLAKVVQNTSNLISPPLLSALDHTGRIPASGDVKYIFLTKSGPGPIRQPIEESILDPTTGLAKAPSSKHKRLQISVPTQGKFSHSKSDNSSDNNIFSYIGCTTLGIAIGCSIAFTLLKK